MVQYHISHRSAQDVRDGAMMRLIEENNKKGVTLNSTVYNDVSAAIEDLTDLVEEALDATGPLDATGQPIGKVLTTDGSGDPNGYHWTTAGIVGTEYDQLTPSATWTFTHLFGRRPNVIVYNAAGQEVFADVTADDMLVTVVFPTPTTGSAVLT